MNNKTNYPTHENNELSLTSVIPYLAENAIFVLCKTSEYNRCHIKFKFSNIVCIRTDGENQSTILTTNGARHTALMVMAEILVWLPESKFARISWNTTVNLTLVERIMGNILYYCCPVKLLDLIKFRAGTVKVSALLIIFAFTTKPK